MYSKLTPNQKDQIVEKFRVALGFTTDVLHAVAVASGVIRKGTTFKQSEDAFAAALATLAMRQEIIVSKGFYRVEDKPGKVEYKQHGPPK